MNLIKLEKNAIIEYSKLDEIAAKVEERLSQYNFKEMVVNEENRKGIKTLRTELSKEYKEFEEARKTIKKKVIEPYEEFEKAYKEKIASLYQNADSDLKTAIDEVENQIKQRIEVEVKEHFETLKKEKMLDFLEFEQANIKVGLSDTVSKLKEQVEQFIDNVDKDIDVIATQKHDRRILVEYKKHLDVRQAISTVLRDIEQEELLMKQEEEIPMVAELKPVVEETIEVLFKATGTRTQLLKLKQFMNDEKIKWES